MLRAARRRWGGGAEAGRRRGGGAEVGQGCGSGQGVDHTARRGVQMRQRADAATQKATRERQGERERERRRADAATHLIVSDLQVTCASPCARDGEALFSAQLGIAYQH